VYNFNPRWGLVLNPFFVGTIGTATNIEDNVNVKPINFTESRRDKYKNIR
jgi:hypothetical protein